VIWESPESQTLSGLVLLSGQVQLLFGNLPSSIEFIRTGKLRPLAVTTANRADALPDLPTVGEFVPGYEVSVTNGIGAPKNTPLGVIEKVSTALNDALSDPKLKARLAEVATSPVPMLPPAFGQFVVSETEKWGKVIRAANIKPE
jgi:tripartite-type tricarboxylate transporter receptor subunit TctC